MLVENKSSVNCTHKFKNKNFIELFQEQVKKNPDSIAIVAKDGKLTYRELDKKSDMLAKYLASIEIKNENLVGLCALLTSNFIICMLGIMKAGAVYFPLDPTYPSDRLEYMIKDGNPAAIMVEPKFTHLFKKNKTIKIEDELFNFKFNSNSPYKGAAFQSDNLAYVIYTSGSTGLPKGIMITHKSLQNIAQAHIGHYPSNIRMLVSGGVCFDASLLVIIHALANGESLYLFNYNPLESINKLLEFIKRNSIEYMIGVPSQYLKLLQMNCKLPLLCVSLTGENLPSSLCELHAKLAPDALLYNEYGPTECAIGTTIAKIYDPKEGKIQKVTVGKPLSNTEVYILDETLKKVPKGSKGEICIGGIGLARGYLNNEALTADKFVWVTFPRKKSIRLYRTGDFGRFLPNGELEFLGRMDFRVQICGDWIDLGEIEYHISHCPEVKESAVIVHDNPKDGKQLVAYITSSKSKIAKNSLLEHLKSLLPKRMIPSRIIQIEKFSFTPNGKIDRDALVHTYG
jgi:amino acid adenylation domain-containing protein